MILNPDFTIFSSFALPFTGNSFGPMDIAVGPDGKIYVARHVQVDVFDGSDYSYIETIVSGGDIITGVAFDSTGQLWIGDAGLDLIYTYGDKPPNPIPEPATILLVGTGLIGLAGFRRKFKK